jgi:hypothetical protein
MRASLKKALPAGRKFAELEGLASHGMSAETEAEQCLFHQHRILRPGARKTRHEKRHIARCLMKTEAILTQTMEQLEHMNEALAALRRELLPGQPKKFALLAEGPLEEMRRLQTEVELLTTQIATAA